MMAPGKKWRKIRGKRGFSHVSMTLEAAAVMGWFVVLVLGEKYVGDATSARRAAEDSVEQSSVASAMSYCAGGGAGASAGSAAAPVQGSADVRQNGKLSISSVLSIIAGLGLGSQKSFPLYTEPFQGAFATASSGGVTPHRLVGEGTHTFSGNRNLACLEPPKAVSPIPDLLSYRSSIFDTTVRGYGPNP